jgi:hypothetical protein
MDDARPHPPPLRQPAPSHLVYCEDVHVGTIGERAGVPVDVDQWQWSCGFYPCLNPLAYRGPCWPTQSRRREGALWGWALKPSLAASGQRSSDKNPDAFGRRRRARTSEEHELGQLPCREATADRARAQRISCKCRATPGAAQGAPAPLVLASEGPALSTPGREFTGAMKPSTRTRWGRRPRHGPKMFPPGSAIIFLFGLDN